MFDTISCLYIGVVLVWLIVLYYLHCKVLLYCNCTVGVLLGHSPVTPLTYGDVYYNIVFMYWRCIGWCIIELVLIVKCYWIVLVGVLLGHSGSGDSSDRGRCLIQYCVYKCIGAVLVGVLLIDFIVSFALWSVTVFYLLVYYYWATLALVTCRTEGDGTPLPCQPTS